MGEVKRCTICGAEFTPRSAAQKKCSVCKNKATRDCAKCGRPIVVDRRNHTKYCSDCIRVAVRETITGSTRVCVICGAEYAPTGAGQKKCPTCRHKSLAPCAHCGRPFANDQRHPAKYCPDCRSAEMSKAHTGVPRRATDKWRAGAKTRAERDREQMLAVQRAAVEASSKSPLAGPFETNINAKIWLLRDPRGNSYQVRNLQKFIREHPNDFPRPESARTILSSLGRKLRGDKSVRAKTCNGWTVLASPTIPPDVQEHLKNLAERRRERDRKLEIADAIRKSIAPMEHRENQ